MSYDVFIGIDPGLQGGITIFEGRKYPKVYRMPVQTEVVRKKKKNSYNLFDLTDIFKPYVGKKVIVFLEKQNPRPGEGSVSSFTAGTGFGSLKGVCIALGFDLEVILPTKWKKDYPELESKEVVAIRKQLDVLKGTKNKGIKKLKDQLKAAAKDAARASASNRYKKIADEFKLKRDDGKAESLLIALFAKNNQ